MVYNQILSLLRLGLAFDFSLEEMLSWNFLKNCPLWEYLVVFCLLDFQIFFLAYSYTLLMPPYSMLLFILLDSCYFLRCLMIFLVLRRVEPSSFSDFRAMRPWGASDVLPSEAVIGTCSSLRMQASLGTLDSTTGLGMKLKLLSLSSLQLSSLNKSMISFFSLSSLVLLSPRLLAKSASQISPKLCLFFQVDTSGRLVKCSLKPGITSILTLSSNTSSNTLLLILSSSSVFSFSSPCCSNFSPLLNSKGFSTRLFKGRCFELTSPCHLQSCLQRILSSSYSILLFSFDGFSVFSPASFSIPISLKCSKFSSSTSSYSSLSSPLSIPGILKSSSPSSGSSLSYFSSFSSSSNSPYKPTSSSSISSILSDSSLFSFSSSSCSSS